MDDHSLEERLLALYKHAVAQHRTDVAEHVWSALEACSQRQDVGGTVHQIAEYRGVFPKASLFVPGALNEEE